MKNIQIKDKKRAFNKSIILFFCQKTVILQKKAKKTDENL